MIRATFPELTSLWHRAARLMSQRGPSGCDGILGSGKGPVRPIRTRTFLRAKSMAFEFDVGRDLCAQPITVHDGCNGPVHPEDVDAFLARVEVIGRKTASRGV